MKKMKKSTKLSHEEMIRFQVEKHNLIDPFKFSSIEEYVLHLIHKKAYTSAARLFENKRVLDLGCNTGYGTAILSKTVKQLVGVDVSGKAIETANRLYGGVGIKFLVIDGKTLPFNDESFDVVVCCQVIEHIVDYKKFIYEIKRVLSANGIVFLTTPNAQIRLYPGMKPWNSLHVKEYNYHEFKTTLDPVFNSINILGLFANEPLYSIEINRVARIRNRHNGFSIYNILKKMLPGKGKNLLNIVRSLLVPKYNGELIKYGVDSFFYKQNDLESALDLLAICSDNEKVVESLKYKILEYN